MYCRYCGKELPEGADRCESCGAYAAGAGQNETNSGSQSAGDNYYQNNTTQYQYDSSYSGGQPVYETQSGARKGFAITSMVLGIIGLVGSCCSMFGFGVPSILLGIVGLILGILGLKSQGKGMAIAGIIMAALNVIIGVLLLILMVASMSMTEQLTPEDLEWIMESVEGLYYFLPKKF